MWQQNITSLYRTISRSICVRTLLHRGIELSVYLYIWQHIYIIESTYQSMSIYIASLLHHCIERSVYLYMWQHYYIIVSNFHPLLCGTASTRHVCRSISLLASAHSISREIPMFSAHFLITQREHHRVLLINHGVICM